MFTKVQKNYYVFSAQKGAYIFIYIDAVLATRFKFKSLAAVARFIRTKIILCHIPRPTMSVSCPIIPEQFFPFPLKIFPISKQFFTICAEIVC